MRDFTEFTVDWGRWSFAEVLLTTHRQRVVLNSSFSSWLPVFSGVPQGIILSPLLFILNLSDLGQFVKCKFNCLLIISPYTTRLLPRQIVCTLKRIYMPSFSGARGG